MSAVRLLRDDDILQAMLLKEAAGWNQTAADWRRLLDLEPEGCFGIERDGRVVATTTVVCYGRRLAWIGMVLTAAGYRGQGLASELMRRALEFTDAREVEWVKLDATAMGRPLYRKFGFIDECPIERWLCPACPPMRDVRIDSTPKGLRQIDEPAFGADRTTLLNHLAAGECALIDGYAYAMGRPGTSAAYFGPCVANSVDSARQCLEWFMALHAGESVYWDLLPDNQEAVNLAKEFGFTRVRELTRMARGSAQPLRTDTQRVYAIAGFEFG